MPFRQDHVQGHLNNSHPYPEESAWLKDIYEFSPVATLQYE
ncbi:MAG: hypothetical protein U9R25_02290 [Chloroflexota bacterium]|nr:hypothetical protein [Chloroflexota bacterium]